MLESIIAVVSAVIIYILKRKLEYEQDKTRQLEDRIQDAAEAIVKGDENQVNHNLAAVLDRLQNQSGGNPSGQGSSENESK
tara:strand:+ start:55 stop:297 length:243 start_codon:yes stop_codon:yes gene_type:complete